MYIYISKRYYYIDYICYVYVFRNIFIYKDILMIVKEKEVMNLYREWDIWVGLEIGRRGGSYMIIF